MTQPDDGAVKKLGGGGRRTRRENQKWKKGENANNMLEPSTDKKLKFKLICEKGIKLFSKGLSVYLGY